MSRISRRLILLLACSVLLLAPLISVQLATGAGRAHACKCSPPPPPLEALDEASAVFSGRVVSFETFSFELDFGSDRTESYWSVQLDVDKVWKGPVASTTFVYVWHGPACGYGNFEIGEDFLVYTQQRIEDQEDNDTLFVSFCSRTRPIENAADDLKALGDGQPPEPGVTGARLASEDEEQAPGSATTDAAAASEDPQRGPVLATTGAAPAPEAGGQTSGSGSTAAITTSEGDGQTPGPGTTDAATTSGDSSRSPAWAIPLLAAIAAALIATRLVTRPRRRR